VAELADYREIGTEQRLVESLGPKAELHRPSAEDVQRITAQYLEEYRLTFETIKEYSEVGEAQLKLAPFFWPSENSQSVTTCCINQSSYGEVWHAVLTYQSLEWVEKQVQEAVSWLRTLDQQDREDYLIMGTNPHGEGDKFRLEAFKLFVKDPTTINDWELKE
jgi:hypothetical protein